jgi:hypothetical protein
MRYYQGLIGPSGVTIYGSAYFLNQNHYYLSLSGTQGGLMIDLDTLALTRQTNSAMQVFDSRPTRRTRRSSGASAGGTRRRPHRR